MAGQDKKILIVDDEEKNIKLLTAALRSWGYTVIAAANGAEALDRIGYDAPDLVIMDVMMPVMNGYEALAAIKNDPERAAIPVIMATALADHDSRIQGLETGADEYITKPIDMQILAVRIRNLLVVKSHGDLLRRYNSDLERMVREKTADLISILGAIGSILIGLDPAGLIRHWNETAERIFEVPSLTAGGAPLAAVVRGLDLDSLMGAVERCRFTGERIMLDDLPHVSPGGVRRILGFTANPIIEDGRTCGVLLLGSDITERRLLEERLL